MCFLDADWWTVIGDKFSAMIGDADIGTLLHYFEFSISAAKQLTHLQFSLESMRGV